MFHSASRSRDVRKPQFMWASEGTQRTDKKSQARLTHVGPGPGFIGFRVLSVRVLNLTILKSAIK